MSSSKVLRGSSFPSSAILLRRLCFISSILAVDTKQRGHMLCNPYRARVTKYRGMRHFCRSSNYLPCVGVHTHIFPTAKTNRKKQLGTSLPVWQLVWFTKMTSSLSSKESGEELESVSMPSESLLLSSVMLITPPLSTVCLGTLGCRPLGFPNWKKFD